MTKPKYINASNVWATLREEAERCARYEPLMKTMIQAHILDHKSFGDALAFVLATKLADNSGDIGLNREALFVLFKATHAERAEIVTAAKHDLIAVMDRDPAVDCARAPFLYFKGYHALQTHRIAHHLWNKKHKDTALYMQSQSSRNLQVDIHPAARFGNRIMIDHATGVVVGATAIVGNDVSILHGVTLGGTGTSSSQKRHPTIGDGVMIGAGAIILGDIEVGEGSRIGAGAVVRRAIPAHKTAVGDPVRIVGHAGASKPSKVMDQVTGTAHEPQETKADMLSRMFAGTK